MPIYEYECRACQAAFEALVRKQKAPACPACGGRDLERLLSLPSVRSDSTRAKSQRAAKKRDRALGRDRMRQRLEYERSHDRHG